MTLRETLNRIKPVDSEAAGVCRARWDAIAKPLHSLGKLEDAVVQIAAICRSAEIDISKKALIVMCADHGIVEEQVSQTGSEVTAVVAGNMTRLQTCTALMCRDAGADLYTIDVGMKTTVPGVIDRKIAPGTENFAKIPAMSRAQAVAAIEVGIHASEKLVHEGYQLLAAGEMGIGNTTASSAAAAVLLGTDPKEVTGKGAGLSNTAFLHKIEVIRQAIELHRPDASDPLDVLAKVGGYDIAGMTGVYLGAAAMCVPVVMDGFISGVAALLAVRLCEQVSDYILASHRSSEPAVRRLLQELRKDPPIDARLCLGEGSGAVAFFPLLDMAAHIYRSMSSFTEIQIEPYVPFDDE